MGFEKKISWIWADWKQRKLVVDMFLDFLKLYSKLVKIMFAV